jgi:hypothetical protein
MGLTGAGIERVPPPRREAIEAVAWARSGPEFRRLLFTVRFTTIVAAVLAGLLLWRIALRFGPGVGLRPTPYPGPTFVACSRFGWAATSRATVVKSSTRRCIATARAASSGARSTADGCSVAMA